MKHRGRTELIAEAVFRRLRREGEHAPIDDAHGYLMRLAEEVELDLAARTPAGLVAELAPEDRQIVAAVNSLSGSERMLLLLHVEGFTYKQIAAKLVVPVPIVLRGLVAAYSNVRIHLAYDEPRVAPKHRFWH